MLNEVEKEVEAVLEQYIDAHGLAEVLDRVAAVCFEKAAHIAASYSQSSKQVDPLSYSWKNAGQRVAATASRAPIKRVSPA